VATVVRGDIAQVLTITAEFRPFEEIDVHAKVSGYLKHIGVDVGDRVKAGQLLATLEVPELEDQRQQDEGAIKRAQEEINRAEAEVERTESAHDMAHLASTRLADVVKARPKLVAQQDLDETAGRDRMAEAQVNTAKAAAASAREQLGIAKADENKTRTLLAYMQISAPFDGVITRRYADPGAMIQAGTSSQTQAMPLVRLSQNSVLRLVIPVPESAVQRIRVGEPVDVRVQSLSRSFPGKVARFADRVDSETRTMPVEVDVSNPSLTLIPGMYAEAALALDQAKDVLVVPIQAIDRGGSGPTVLVVTSSGQVESRPIRLGLEAADRVEVNSGLNAGDLVVVGNRSQLKPGVVVTPKVIGSGSDGGQ
jgi:RND family efflux transporter MFP subunit